MKKIKEIIINIVLIAILFCIAIMVFYNLYYFFAGFEKTDYLWKTKKNVCVIAKDDMMFPYINKNEIVVFKKCDDKDLKNEDIIYIEESGSKKISKIENIKIDSTGVKYYTTKGEKNYYYNSEDVSIEKIEGKFDKKINFIGNILKFVSSKVFSVISVCITIILFIIMEKNYKKSEARKKKKENGMMKNK